LRSIGVDATSFEEARLGCQQPKIDRNTVFGEAIALAELVLVPFYQHAFGHEPLNEDPVSRSPLDRRPDRGHVVETEDAAAELRGAREPAEQLVGTIANTSRDLDRRAF